MMVPTLRHIGAGGHPLLIVDNCPGDPATIRAMVAARGPLPAVTGNLYPGLRLPITHTDPEAAAYVDELLTALAPFIGGAFDADGFNITEAGFSVVTRPASELKPNQRAPHFDSVDPNCLAILHYLFDPPSGGTAFFRHRSTGIEAVDQGTGALLADFAVRENPTLSGYCAGDSAYYEQIGMVEARPGRVAVYPCRVLHSGIIGPELSLDPSPLTGRLTTNIFIRCQRG